MPRDVHGTLTLSIEVFDNDPIAGFSQLGKDDYMGSVELVLRPGDEKTGVHKGHTLPLKNLKPNKKNKMVLSGNGESSTDNPFGTLTFTCSIERPRANDNLSALKEDQKTEKYTKWLTVDVLQARDLCPVSKKGDHKPLVEVRLGGKREKSKRNVQRSRPAINTLAPQWKERFEFQLAADQFSLSFSVYNQSVDPKNAMGKAFLPLHSVTGEKANLFWLPLNSDEDLGFILVAVTITDSEPKEPVTVVGKSTAAILQVTVIKANHLKAADIGGKSDPFCVVQVGEQRQRTQTIPKTISPVWKRNMEFQIDGIDHTLKLADVKSDIFGHIDFTVYDQDSGGKAEFLGCLRIPILSIVNHGQSQWWALKDQDMMVRVKGELELKLELKVEKEWMARFALFSRQPRLVSDRGGKFKVKKLQFTVGRVTKLLSAVVNFVGVVEMCVKWQLGIIPGLVSCTAFQYLCHCGKLWMVPVPILTILVWHWLHVQPRSDLLQAVGEKKQVRPVYDDDDASQDEPDEENETEGEETQKEKSGIRAKYKKVIQILQVVQDKLGLVVAIFERVKHLVIGEVPLITLGLAVILLLISVVTYLRYLVEIHLLLSILGGAFFASNFVKVYVIPFATGKKFKKIPKPNKVLEILARIPSQSQLQQYRRLAPQTMSIQAARRGNILGDGNGGDVDA